MKTPASVFQLLPVASVYELVSTAGLYEAHIILAYGSTGTVGGRRTSKLLERVPQTRTGGPIPRLMLVNARE